MWPRNRLHLIFCFTLCVLSVLGAQAQTRIETPRSAPLVTASLAAEQVRFAALPSIYQLRLEVFAVTGVKVFDSDFKSSNLLDWALLDQQEQRLPDGNYLCLVTARDFNGRFSQQQGAVSLLNGEITLLSLEQAEATIRELYTGWQGHAPSHWRSCPQAQA